MFGADDLWKALRGVQGDLSPVDEKAINAVVALVSQIEEARKEIDAHGLLLTNDKGMLVENPAARVERAASSELRGWLKDRPDLFKSDAGRKPRREKFTGLTAVGD